MKHATEAFGLYRQLINLHDFSQLEERLIDPEITCIFGQEVHRGPPAVRAAFETAWRSLPDERYEMSDPQWIATDTNIAVAVFDYRFEGTNLYGELVTGGGRGTNVYRRKGEGWRLVHEHLSPTLLPTSDT